MKVFWSFARQAFHSTAVYRFDFWLRLVTTFLLMYAAHWVWTTLYTQSPGAFGVSLPQMVTYGVLGMALQTILHPGYGPQAYIATQVRIGAIDLDLVKPLDFHLHMLARNAGETLFRFSVQSVPTLLVGYLLLGLQPPRGAQAALLFALSLALGYLVLFSLNFLIGLLAVVTLDIRNINWAYNALIGFLAGQMVPLWLFPRAINALAELLPFKSIYYIPMSIYIGRLQGLAAWQALGFQAVWLVLLVLAGRWGWGRVHARLVVQGG